MWRARTPATCCSGQPTECNNFGISTLEQKVYSGFATRLNEGITIDAFWLGAAYQRVLDVISDRYDATRNRRTRGIFYTPEPLVRHVVEQTCSGALIESSKAPLRILDPACGCGGFLIATARRLRDLRPDLSVEVIARSFHGIDIDPLAITLCRLALWLEVGDSSDPDDTPERFTQQIRVADALLAPQAARPFDLVLGNPPFLNQLAASTTRSSSITSKLRERFGDSVRAYTDPAALFLQLAIDSTRPGGRVGMVLPVSLLASRDAAPVRSYINRTATMRSLWLDQDGVFNAQVRAVALTFERQPAVPRPLTRHIGEKFELSPSCSTVPSEMPPWGSLAADMIGIPRVRLSMCHTLGEVCNITAGFRDEYYAVARHLCESPETECKEQLPESLRPVVTVGMIDPAHNTWEERPVRIAKRHWVRPCIDADADDAVLAKLTTQQGRPKLLVATQTRVIEAAADPEGQFVALTPVITVIPHDPADLWSLGALLSCPAISAWIAAQTFGTARSLHAIKPSAVLLRGLPCPVNLDSLTAAANCYQRATKATDAEARTHYLIKAAHASNLACGVSEAESETLVAWWRPRLPVPRYTRRDRSRFR